MMCHMIVEQALLIFDWHNYDVHFSVWYIHNPQLCETILVPLNDVFSVIVWALRRETYAKLWWRCFVWKCLHGWLRKNLCLQDLFKVFWVKKNIDFSKLPTMSALIFKNQTSPSGSRESCKWIIRKRLCFVQGYFMFHNKLRSSEKRSWNQLNHVLGMLTFVMVLSYFLPDCIRTLWSWVCWLRRPSFGPKGSEKLPSL